MQEELIARAIELLRDGTVTRVLGWRKGEFLYDVTPDVFTDPDDLKENFVYDDFNGENLSKYLIKQSVEKEKILVFLKPCDTYSFNQLITEHRIIRDRVYIIGVPCDGMLDIENIRANKITGIESIERGTADSEGNSEITFTTIYGTEKLPLDKALAERCVSCKSRKHVVYDELFGKEGKILDRKRFSEVEKIEAMSSDERFAFWQGELSRCIRCNACRNVCPACTCEKCVFDNPDSGAENKAASDSFEESMFHIIRAYHVAGRCTDCGECSRVCPEHIPLHLLNRKFIKDINELYGEFQAGDEIDQKSPLVEYTAGDIEPKDAIKGGAQ